MKKFTEIKKKENLFEKANYSSKKTGLPMIIWVSSERGSHGARIKVANNYNPRVMIEDTFSVSVSENPKVLTGEQRDISNNDLQKVFSWIKLNLEPLLKYWNAELTTDEFGELLKKL
jgi:hypothetical protein